MEEIYLEKSQEIEVLLDRKLDEIKYFSPKLYYSIETMDSERVCHSIDHFINQTSLTGRMNMI